MQAWWTEDNYFKKNPIVLSKNAWLSVCMYEWVCVCGHVYVVYEDTNLYNDMGMTQVLQGEGDLWGHFQCPHNLKRL